MSTTFTGPQPSPLIQKLQAFLNANGAHDVVIHYGASPHSLKALPAHSAVLRAKSYRFEKDFASGVLRPGMTIGVGAPYDDRAWEDMLEYIYVGTYDVISGDEGMPMLDLARAMVMQHNGAYEIADRYEILGLEKTALYYLDTLIKQTMRTIGDDAELALAFVTVLVQVIFGGLVAQEDNDDEVPPISQWPARAIVCEVATRLWAKTGEMDTDEQGEQSGKEILKAGLAKLCWNYVVFGQEWATWMVGTDGIEVILEDDV